MQNKKGKVKEQPRRRHMSGSRDRADLVHVADQTGEPWDSSSTDCRQDPRALSFPFFPTVSRFTSVTAHVRLGTFVPVQVSFPRFVSEWVKIKERTTTLFFLSMLFFPSMGVTVRSMAFYFQCN